MVGYPHEIKGTAIYAFVTLNAGEEGSEALRQDLVREVRHDISGIAAPDVIYFTPVLPKTRSGKILRGTMKKIADGEPWAMPATIEDPATLDEIGSALKRRGLAAG